MAVQTAKPRTVFHVFSTLNVGGPQVRFATTVNKLGPDFQHLVFAMDHGYESTKLLDPGVPCEIYEFDYAKGRTVANFLTFRSVLKDLKPDVLVTYNWGAIEWAVANLFRGCPHIHIVDGFGPEEADRQLPRRVLFRRFALAGETTIVVPSHTLEDIVTRVWRQNPAKVVYLPNGIDCARFEIPRDETLADEFGIPADATVIGTVAALRREKNLGRLLDAFDDMPEKQELRLMIVGDGPEREPMQAKAEKLGIADRVIFTGYLSDPAAILSLFDIFAISSDTEQMPISVLEAMASGLPIAGVDVGDVRHIVSEANEGFIVERDAERLGRTMSKFAGDPALRKSVGEANRAHVRTVYDEATMIEAYGRLFSGQSVGQ